MVKKLIATLLMSGLNLFPFGISVQAEVIQEYNEFSGETMVMSLTKEWDEKTPTLFLNTTFQGKKNEEVPSLMFFSVIAPISKYMSCAKGVSGVIADGERVKSADDDNYRLSTRPKMRALENGTGHIELWGRYKPKDFMQIVNATEVKYQLCGEEVYTLTPEEQEILKEYTAIILNSDIWPEQ